MLTILLLTLAAPIPFEKVTAGDYILMDNDTRYELSLDKQGTYALWKNGRQKHCGHWNVEGNKLYLGYGRLDVLGLPPGVKPGYAHYICIPIFKGKGYDSDEWKYYELIKDGVKDVDFRNSRIKDVDLPKIGKR